MFKPNNKATTTKYPAETKVKLVCSEPKTAKTYCILSVKLIASEDKTCPIEIRLGSRIVDTTTNNEIEVASKAYLGQLSTLCSTLIMTTPLVLQLRLVAQQQIEVGLHLSGKSFQLDQ